MVGGGKIVYYLLDMLKTTKIHPKVIEVNEERAKFLSEQFPNATIIHADGTDHDVLEEEMLTNYDAFVSLTGIDEENLILSVYANIVVFEKLLLK